RGTEAGFDDGREHRRRHLSEAHGEAETRDAVAFGTGDCEIAAPGLADLTGLGHRNGGPDHLAAVRGRSRKAVVGRGEENRPDKQEQPEMVAEDQSLSLSSSREAFLMSAAS